MKKLLAALLVFATILSLSFSLVSCGKEDEEPSKPVAASSEEPATVVSSEDEQPSEQPSADESVEAPSAEVSAEASVEAPSEEVSQVAVDYKTSPADTNYAANSTYTVTRNGDTDPVMYLSYDGGSTDWADLDCKKLTDGVIVTDASTYDSLKAAMPGITVQYVGTDAAFEFIFDLGDHYGDIKSLVFKNVRHGTPNGNNRGFEVKLVKPSDDGVNWKDRVKGELTSVYVAGAPEIESKLEEGAKNVEHFDFTYTFNEPVQARYLKITLSDDGGYVMQLEELEIRN